MIGPSPDKNYPWPKSWKPFASEKEEKDWNKEMDEHMKRPMPLFDEKKKTDD